MKYTIGADESGCGNAAGILCVVAVKAPTHWNLDGLNDSKKISEKKRNELLIKLVNLKQLNEISFSLAFKSAIEVDKKGLATCLDECYIDVIKELYDDNSYVIWDGSRQIRGIDYVCKVGTYKSLIKADTILPHAMAASIIAKCYRDNDIDKLHLLHPEYNWLKNKGYPTPEHIKAINKYGYTEFHRKTFKIKGLTNV